MPTRRHFLSLAAAAPLLAGRAFPAAKEPWLLGQGVQAPHGVHQPGVAATSPSSPASTTSSTSAPPSTASTPTSSSSIPRPRSRSMVMDVHNVIGLAGKGFAAQAKIHTRNNVGAIGKIYVGYQAGLPREGRTPLATTPAATSSPTTRRPARTNTSASPRRSTASSASRPTSRAAWPTSRPAPTTGPSITRTSWSST